jgi:hypothetical protein
MIDHSQRLLRRAEAAAYIRTIYNIPCEPSSLRTVAYTGKGPTFQKVGRYPVYAVSDLDAWVLAKTSPRVSSTAELSALRPIGRMAEAVRDEGQTGRRLSSGRRFSR